MLLVFSSCEVIPPELDEVKDVQLVAFEGNKLTFEAVLPVSNENWHRIRVYRVDLDVYVDGRKLGTVTDANQIQLKRKSTTDQRIGLDLEMPGLLSGGLSLMKMLNQERLHLSIRGEVTAGSFLIMRKTVRVNESFSVRLR